MVYPQHKLTKLSAAKTPLSIYPTPGNALLRLWLSHKTQHIFTLQNSNCQLASCVAQGLTYHRSYMHNKLDHSNEGKTIARSTTSSVRHTEYRSKEEIKRTYMLKPWGLVTSSTTPIDHNLWVSSYPPHQNLRLCESGRLNVHAIQNWWIGRVWFSVLRPWVHSGSFHQPHRSAS